MEKRSPKPDFTGLRTGLSGSFEFYRTAIIEFLSHADDVRVGPVAPQQGIGEGAVAIVRRPCALGVKVGKGEGK